MDLELTARRCAAVLPDDGRSRVAVLAAGRLHVRAVFDTHPFDHLVGDDRLGGDLDGDRLAVLATPTVLPPCPRLSTGPCRPGAAVTVVAGDGRVGTAGRPPAVVAALARRLAGHDVPLPAALVDVLGSWWVRLAGRACTGRAASDAWAELAGLRPDVLLGFLADVQLDGRPLLVPAVDPTDGRLAAPHPVGSRLLAAGCDVWALAVHDAAVAAAGRSRLRPALDPDESAWVGSGLVARLELGPVTAGWRAALAGLAVDPSVHPALASGLLGSLT